MWGCSVCSLTPVPEGQKKPFNGSEDERFALEWCYFTSIGPPQPVTCKELIGTYNLAPDSVWIKYNLITIPHL